MQRLQAAYRHRLSLACPMGLLRSCCHAQAYHRAGQAALALQDHSQALALLDRGLQQQPDAAELQSLRQVTLELSRLSAAFELSPQPVLG